MAGFADWSLCNHQVPQRVSESSIICIESVKNFAFSNHKPPHPFHLFDSIQSNHCVHWEKLEKRCSCMQWSQTHAENCKFSQEGLAQPNPEDVVSISICKSLWHINCHHGLEPLNGRASWSWLWRETLPLGKISVNLLGTKVSTQVWCIIPRTAGLLIPQTHILITSHCSSPWLASPMTQIHPRVLNGNQFSFPMACVQNHLPLPMLWCNSCWVQCQNSKMVSRDCAGLLLQAWQVISPPQPQQQKQNQHNSTMAN